MLFIVLHDHNVAGQAGPATALFLMVASIIVVAAGMWVHLPSMGNCDQDHVNADVALIVVMAVFASLSAGMHVAASL